jgi:hypothetical protein
VEKTPRLGAELSIKRIDFLVTLAARSIRQLCKIFVKLDDISEWVRVSFHAPETMVTFINNLPVDVLGIISLGVFRDTEC